MRRRAAQKAMGDMYFDSAIKKIHQAHMDVSSTATHCLFFTAYVFPLLQNSLFTP